MVSFCVVGFLRGGCSRGEGDWGTLRIPREDWGTLGNIPPLRIYEKVTRTQRVVNMTSNLETEEGHVLNHLEHIISRKLPWGKNTT